MMGAAMALVMKITPAQLQAVMPRLPAPKAEEYAPHLAYAMLKADINTPKRCAAFLAQLAHESGEFRWMEEIADGSAYEGRKDLGNTQPGDGKRFKGRGPIQLTGRANYIKAGQALGVDLIAHPALAATAEIGFQVAAWYWNTRGLNSKADAGDLKGITKAINGGYNGLSDREKYYVRACEVLGVSEEPLA